MKDRVIDRVGVSGLLALPAVAIVVYLTTGDASAAIIGPAVVGLVIILVAYSESTGTDVRYLKAVIYAVGVPAAVVMMIAPTIPMWFAVGVAIVSAWLLVDTIVDLCERDVEEFPIPHSIEDKLQADIASAIVTELHGRGYVPLKTIAYRLDVGEQRVESVLDTMCERKLVEQDGNRYRIHPDSESFTHVLRRVWRRLLRPARIVRHVL